MVLGEDVECASFFDVLFLLDLIDFIDLTSDSSATAAVLTMFTALAAFIAQSCSAAHVECNSTARESDANIPVNNKLLFLAVSALARSMSVWIQATLNGVGMSGTAEVWGVNLESDVFSSDGG
jgi:hypothetical protein